jgi:ABC-type cobalamin transport system permease subunit
VGKLSLNNSSHLQKKNLVNTVPLLLICSKHIQPLDLLQVQHFINGSCGFIIWESIIVAVINVTCLFGVKTKQNGVLVKLGVEIPNVDNLNNISDNCRSQGKNWAITALERSPVLIMFSNQ